MCKEKEFLLTNNTSPVTSGNNIIWDKAPFFLKKNKGIRTQFSLFTARQLLFYSEVLLLSFIL